MQLASCLVRNAQAHAAAQPCRHTNSEAFPALKRLCDVYIPSMLEVRKNEISLRKLSGGSAQLRTLEGITGHEKRGSKPAPTSYLRWEQRLLKVCRKYSKLFEACARKLTWLAAMTAWARVASFKTAGATTQAYLAAELESTTMERPQSEKHRGRIFASGKAGGVNFATVGPNTHDVIWCSHSRRV